MGYRFLNHTADVAFDVEAPTRDELFAEALAAFTDTLTERETVEERVTRRFELRSSLLDLLLVDWLTELLYSFETEGLLFRRADVRVTEEDGAFLLTADARGEAEDPERHQGKVLVKAVTYHGLEVVEEGDGWRARVVFDI
ncbi:MAG TPA: archease [Thermoanaerobaculia bacterium]|nr:archease [Thermoanaerobaculia bacterium]